MLIYYKFNNFCSFNSENEFSMIAAAGKVKKRFPYNYVDTETGYSLLKSAVIVGENAGGKSNFINSLKYLRSLFVTNSPVKAIPAYVNAVSMKEQEQPIQEFKICFKSNNGKTYIYELHIDFAGIVYEGLTVEKRKQLVPSTIFEVNRKEEGKLEFAVQNMKTISKVSQKSVLGNSIPEGVRIGLIVSKCALLGDEDAIAVVDWMTNVLCPEDLEGATVENHIDKKEDIDILRDHRFLEIFRMVDYSIYTLIIDKENPFTKTIIVRDDENEHRVSRELQMDSRGVREFFAWAVLIYKVVYQNKVVLADEMDRVLNPILSDRVVAFVNGTDHTGQFIFTTHNALHLNLKTYMKEQIYFITKSIEYLNSEIYSLSDFPDIRYETTKVYEFYMKGILGGTAIE